MSFGIEMASTPDIPEILGIGEDMHAESSFAHMTFDRDELAGFLSAAIDLPTLDIILAVGHDRIMGFLICSVVKSYFGPDLTAQEFAMYVRPEHRGSGAARGLIRAYVEWARDKGAKRVTSGNSAGTLDAAFVALTEAEGMERMGSIMISKLG